MKRFKYILLASAFACGAFFTACNDNENAPVFPEQHEKNYDMSGFAKGADVSWLTEMENSGYLFYDTDGKDRECMELLRSLGMTLSACAYG